MINIFHTLNYHVIRKHQFEPDFRIPCMVCPQTLKTLKSYQQHKKKCSQVVVQNEQEMELDEQKGEQNEDEQNGTRSFWQCKRCKEKIPINIIQTIEDFQKLTKVHFT